MSNRMKRVRQWRILARILPPVWRHQAVADVMGHSPVWWGISPWRTMNGFIRLRISITLGLLAVAILLVQYGTTVAVASVGAAQRPRTPPRLRRLPPLETVSTPAARDPAVNTVQLGDARDQLADRQPTIPKAFEPWWTQGVLHPQQSTTPPRGISVESLVVDALKHAPEIRASTYLPLARETSIVEAQSEFDLHAFLDSTFDRPSDPVGNELTTGGPQRYREQNWGQVVGMRRKTTLGGSIELSQRLGYQQTNSIFFVPPQQGNSRFVISFTQPLLRAAGKRYNMSRTVLAQIDTNISWDRFATKLQDYLLRVTRAYWELYLRRAVLLQRQRLYEQARKIHEDLKAREMIDATRSQIVRARAAVAARRSELARARQDIRNAEAEIRALVGATSPAGGRTLELIPVELPMRTHRSVDLQTERRMALQYRPEMNQAIQQLRAASVRLNIAKKDLLPALDFVMESYVAGLEGEGNIGQAFANQFSVGEPGYSVGLKFEVPIGRRGPKANYRRRMLELRHLASQLDATANTLLTEVEVGVGEVNTAYREMQGKYEAMIAAEEDVNYLQQRWERVPGEDRAASFVLEDLLDAQDRLAIESYNFAQSEVNYTMAQVRLKRATGTLLQYAKVTCQRDCHDGTEQLILEHVPAE